MEAGARAGPRYLPSLRYLLSLRPETGAGAGLRFLKIPSLLKTRDRCGSRHIFRALEGLRASGTSSTYTLRMQQVREPLLKGNLGLSGLPPSLFSRGLRDLYLLGGSPRLGPQGPLPPPFHKILYFMKGVPVRMRQVREQGYLGLYADPLSELSEYRHRCASRDPFSECSRHRYTGIGTRAGIFFLSAGIGARAGSL
jgi:hypothetical protein